MSRINSTATSPVQGSGWSLFRRRAAAGWPALLLLACTFVDELLAGIPVVGLPLIRDGLGLSYGQAGLLLTIGGLVAMVVEPVLFAWARGRKHLLVVMAVMGLAGCELAAAGSPGFGWLLVAIGLSAPWGGLALGMAQSHMIDLNPGQDQRTMMRWMLLGSLGDVLAPVLVAGLAALAVSWRGMFAVSGATWAVYGMALWVWPVRSGGGVVAIPEGPAGQSGRWKSFVGALRNRELIRWAIMLELICLLDEILVGFASLYLRDVVGVSMTAVAIILGVGMAGTVVSLPVWERVAGRVEAVRLLRWMSAGVLVGLTMLLCARGRVMAAAAMALMGVAGAGLYPVLKTQAYRCLPGESNTVLAALAVMAPIGAAMPWVMGVIAERLGLPVALGMTGLAPVAILALARRRRQGFDDGRSGPSQSVS